MLWDVRRAVRLAWVACIACASLAGAVAACSSFGDGTTSDGADAGQDATSGSDGQSTTDARVIGTESDAGNDAVTDATTARLCADSGHWLCDDFDRVGSPGFSAWDSVILLGDGGVAIASFATAPSPPNVATSTVGGGAQARLAKGRTGSSSTFRCELDLFVEARNTSEAILFDMSLNGATYYYRVELRGGPADAVNHYGAFDGASTSPVVNGVVFTKGWHHVIASLSAGNNPSVDVTMDGVAVTHAAIGTAATLPSSTSQSVVTGLYSLGGAGDWVVHYDNVFCDL
jgi:hypothetical protein